MLLTIWTHFLLPSFRFHRAFIVLSYPSWPAPSLRHMIHLYYQEKKEYLSNWTIPTTKVFQNKSFSIAVIFLIIIILQLKDNSLYEGFILNLEFWLFAYSILTHECRPFSSIVLSSFLFVNCRTLVWQLTNAYSTTVKQAFDSWQIINRLYLSC